jgi:tetratricopeptide (TPR) repeat protein/protein involved in polysaccharide export with SLBB domain
MKKMLMFGLLVCLVVAPHARAVAQRQNGAPADTYYRDGARFALEGRLSEAAHAFEQAIALDPFNGNAHYALGNVYAEMGRWADAVRAYHLALSLNRDDVEALNNLGVALGMRGQHVQAAAAFERAIKIYPKWGEPHYHLSTERRALGQEKEARESYERALRLRPDYASRPPRPFANAAAKIGPAAPASGQILKAMDAVGVGGVPERVAASPPPAGGATADNGTRAPAATTTPAPNAEADTTRPVTPRADSTRAANASPPPSRPAAAAPASPYETGLREARAGRHREAVASFRQAVLLERGNAAAYRALGDAYAELGEWREAVDAYEQAARLAPDDAETYQKLGRSYTKLRETAASEAPREAAAATPAGASSTPPRPASNDGPNAAPNADRDADPTAVYRIGAGDVLDVRLLRGADPRTTSYKVTPTGLLDHPALREPLAVEGLTPDEAAARLGSALKLRAGETVVGVREYASHAIIVGGMAKEPGTKIIQREAVPLYVVVAHAQPLAGAGQAVVVSRATGRTVEADLSDATAMKTLVRPGDVVTLRELPKRFVYVGGAVSRPGQKDFHTGLTLTQAVLAAGGVSPQGGRASAVTVTRQGDDGRLSTSRYVLAEIESGRTPDPVLRPGDRVEVLR